MRKKTIRTMLIAVLTVICSAFSAIFAVTLNTVAFAATTGTEPPKDVVLDMNGTEANLETDKGVNTNVDNVLNSWGIFPEATGATKMMFTKEEVAAGETFTIRFNKAYKASDLLFVKIRIATNPAAGVTEAYSLADSGCTTSAGTLTSGSGVNNYNYYLDPAKLADADGYISGIILKRTSGEASSYYYFNYVELRTNSTGFDMDGEEAVLTAEGEITVRADNTFNNTGSLDWGMFPEATGATKLSRTESNVAVGKTVTVEFVSPIKAAANKGINVRLATENFQCVLQGYSLGDTAFVYSASVVKATGAGVSNFNVVMPSEILADSDGYVRGFVIKNTSGGEGILDFNYVNVTELSSKYDLDGTEATIEPAGEVQIHADNTFNNTGSLDWGIFPEAEGKTKLMRTAGGIKEGETFDITFAVPMKAESGKAVRVRMASEDSRGVTAGYALSDSSAEKVAGWKAVGGGNVNFMLVLDSVVLADGDGYIRGIRIKRTSGSPVVYDVDYVELGDAEDIKLDMDLTEAWFEAGGVKLNNSHADNNEVLNMFEGDGSSKITWTDTVKENESFNVKFGNKVSAALYPYLNFRVAVGNWTKDTSVVSEIYSLNGKLVGSFITGYGNVVKTVLISTSSIADFDGFAEGFTIKKASGTAGQYFADYIELLKNNVYTVSITDGETTSKNYALGSEVNLWELGVADGENDKVVGYKINGKLYTENYSFIVTENVEIEVVRIAFKMKMGAAIRRSGDMGLRFIVDLNDADFVALQNLVGENNLTLGIAITKKDNGKTVEKPATNRIYDENGNIVYCGVVTNIPEAAYKTQFFAQGFIDVTYENGADRLHAVENDNIRSVYEVATNALASGTLTAEETTFFEGIKKIAEDNASSLAKIILPDYDSKKSEYGIDVAGWLIPLNVSVSDVDYITEAGINVMHAVAAGDEETLYFPEYNANAIAKLNFFRDKGIKIYVNTCSKDGSSFKKIKDFGTHDGVVGMSYDEPTKAEIDDIAKYVTYFNENGNGKNMFVNLYPSFSPAIDDFGKFYNTTRQKYELYLQYYCDKVLSGLTSGEKWLSADRYLLTYDKNGNKCLDSGWLADVQSIAKIAKANGVKKNFFVQTMAYGATNGVASGAQEGSRDRVPTYNDIRLQEYSLMAFGYDGISLFCYGSPAAGGEFSLSQTGMIDRSGNKTETYEAVKKANGEILAFDHVLKQFAWQGVFTCDGGKSITGASSTSVSTFKSIERISLANVTSLLKVSASQNTLFGYFKDDSNNDGIMIVNYNEASENLTDSVELTFDSSKYNAAVCYIGGEKQVFTGLTGGKLMLNLGAGEGVFVIPYAE